MKHTINADRHTTLRVSLSHAQKGTIGEGELTFGYGCIASVSLDDFSLALDLNDEQLASGMLAVAATGRKLSLFKCTRLEHVIYPGFVVMGDSRDSLFESFKVRYSNVSEWFFQQMHINCQLGNNIKWQANPEPLVANVSTPNRDFRIESFYVANLEGVGEERTLHQHFEFRFTAAKNTFSIDEIQDLVQQFGNLLSILLTYTCQILSVDVSLKGTSYGRMYYGIHELRPNEIQNQDEKNKVTWHKFLTKKTDIDGCWEKLNNAYFQSSYREVIWSRLAGMQKHEGFWEYRVLGYVTILDGYVSQCIGKKSSAKLPPTKKLLKLKNALENDQLSLNSTQQTAIMDAASKIFAVSNTFPSKLQSLLEGLDPDVLRIINLKQGDVDLVKQMRDEVAHGLQLTFTGQNITPVFEITNRIILLLTYLFFEDIGLGRDVFLLCLSRPLTELRMLSKLDQVHLDRTLSPEIFLNVSTSDFQKIQQRSKRLLYSCLERNLAGELIYAEELSVALDKATRERSSGVLKFHELLCVPENSTKFLNNAYVEDGVQTLSIHSLVIIDLARISA